MTSLGNTVLVRTQQEYELLLSLATSRAGWFDPTAAYGVVTFTTPQAAVEARRVA